MRALANRTALVTGGASGIGHAIVELLLSRGADVIIFDKVLATLIAHHRHAQVFVVDISDSESLCQVFSQITRKIDILVNCAGIDLDVDLVNDYNNMWRIVFQTNLEGTRMVTSHVLRKMIDGGHGGSIIFITSVHTAQAFMGGAAYDASKHAIIGLMRSIALEYGRCGIRSNAVAPGSIDDAGRTQFLSKADKVRFGRAIPLGRLGSPIDIAHAVAFLASDDASYINGAEIRVDGGLSIKSALF